MIEAGLSRLINKMNKEKIRPNEIRLGNYVYEVEETQVIYPGVTNYLRLFKSNWLLASFPKTTNSLLQLINK